MKVDFKSLAVVVNHLDKTTPKLLPLYLDKDKQHDLYAVTITYKPSYELEVTRVVTKVFNINAKHEFDRIKHRTEKIFKVKLSHQDRHRQIELSGNQLIKDLDGLHYVLYPEFTQRGIVHWHGIIYHPLVNSKLVEDMICTQLRRYGKQQDVKRVVSIPSWVQYMCKEERDPICYPPL